MRDDGQFLDTLYDDALQTAFYYLAGLERIKYLPHIGYHYNKEYGANDDSNRYKLYYRRSIFQYLLSLEPLEKLTSLEGKTKNFEVNNVL